MSAPAQARTLAVGHARSTVRRSDSVPKVKGEFLYSSDLHAAGHALGTDGAQSARPCAGRACRRLGGGDHARRPHRAHARGRARRQALRARVPRPACARDRPRALLRRAGRHRGRRGAGAGPARGSGGARRVRAARASRRRGARHRDGAAPSGSPDDGARLPRRPAPERRPVARHHARRPGGGGRRVCLRRIRDRPAGPGVPRPRVGHRHPGRGGWCRHPRRDAVAARRSRPGRAVPRPRARTRCGSTSAASGARSAGARTSRCRFTPRCSRSARAAR